MMRVYFNGRLAGTWVEDEFMPFTAGSETGAGYVAAAIGHKEQKDANQDSVDATIHAAQIAADATIKAQELAIQAQKDATAQSVQAAKDAAQQANTLIADANILVEKYTQEGIDFSNTEAERAVAQIQGIFKDVYDKNVEGFQQTYNAIKQEYDAGYRDIEKNLAGYMQTGEKANARLQDLSGVNGAEAGKNALITDPSYQWRVDQGRQAIERSAIGDKNLFSGKTLMDLDKYGQDMGSQEFDNAFKRLLTLSEQGRSAANSLSGYRWNSSVARAGNEGARGDATSAARSRYGDQGAGLQNYLSSNRQANNQLLTNTRNQNTMNAANVATTGAQNVSNATAGGAQNVANIGIQGAYNTGNALANQAYQIGGAQSQFAQANAQNTINTLNNAANYTDTISVNAYNRGMDVASTAASMYGGGK